VRIEGRSLFFSGVCAACREGAWQQARQERERQARQKE
jgi:hypothetical protein